MIKPPEICKTCKHFALPYTSNVSWHIGKCAYWQKWGANCTSYTREYFHELDSCVNWELSPGVSCLENAIKEADAHHS